MADAPSSLTVYAREVQATESHLIIDTHHGRHEIRFKLRSEKLSQAIQAERTQMGLSPSGCAIRWPLLDPVRKKTPPREPPKSYVISCFRGRAGARWRRSQRASASVPNDSRGKGFSATASTVSR